MSRERPINPRFDEDVHFNLVTPGPARYRTRTDKPVRYLTMVDKEGGAVLGYVWANDKDDAAGWVVPSGLSANAINAGARWLRALRGGKARELAPTALLAELAGGANDDELSHAVPGSLSEAPTLASLKEMAAGG